MLSLSAIFIILGIHWLGDFVLQTDWQAKNKSKNDLALLSHTVTYTATWLLLFMCGWDTYSLLTFMCITFVFHTATDYFTSRLNTRLYEEGKIHYFFVSIGFDQILHYIQLILTYYYLKHE